MIEKICFFLLEYLSSHALDPCNLFVGCTPSNLALSTLFSQLEGERKADERGEEGRDKGTGEEVLRVKIGQKTPCDTPSSPDFLSLLFRWSALKDTPSQVIREIDFLLSSQNIVRPAGDYVAVNVSNFQNNRLVWECLIRICMLLNFFHPHRQWFWDREIDSDGSYKYVLFRLSRAFLSTDTVAHVLFSFFYFILPPNRFSFLF